MYVSKIVSLLLSKEYLMTLCFVITCGSALAYLQHLSVSVQFKQNWFFFFLFFVQKRSLLLCEIVR